MKVKIGTAINHSEGHSWLCSRRYLGSYKTASLGGHRYFVSFVDNLSRRYWTYPM